MGKAPGFEVDGRKLIAQLGKLADRVGKRVAKKAVNAGTTVIFKEVRRDTPQGETGELRRSIGRKTKQYQQADRTVGIIGPRIGGGYLGYHGHLVHDGHLNVDGSFTPGNPWLKRAAANAMPRAAKSMMDKLRVELEKEAARP